LSPVSKENNWNEGSVRNEEVRHNRIARENNVQKKRRLRNRKSQCAGESNKEPLRFCEFEF